MSMMKDDLLSGDFTADAPPAATLAEFRAARANSAAAVELAEILQQEITRLRDENAQLREALRTAAGDQCTCGLVEVVEKCCTS